MKPSYITHLPHPRSNKWAIVTIAIYGGSTVIMLSLGVIAWIILK